MAAWECVELGSWGWALDELTRSACPKAAVTGMWSVDWFKPGSEVRLCFAGSSLFVVVTLDLAHRFVQARCRCEAQLCGAIAVAARAEIPCKIQLLCTDFQRFVSGILFPSLLSWSKSIVGCWTRTVPVPTSNEMPALCICLFLSSLDTFIYSSVCLCWL